jgi:hypothetical protein
MFYTWYSVKSLDPIGFTPVIFLGQDQQDRQDIGVSTDIIILLKFLFPIGFIG